MAAILQTTFPNLFLMKLYEFWSKFHWSLFIMIRLNIIQHWWPGIERTTSDSLNQWCVFRSWYLWRLRQQFCINNYAKICPHNCVCWCPCMVKDEDVCKHMADSWVLAHVPLSIFRSNSKFDENSERSSFKYIRPITTIFVTLSWRVQNIVVIGRVYFTLECFEFSSNFEFDRNMLSGTGAWYSCGATTPYDR